jgi:hypothetical protein
VKHTSGCVFEDISRGLTKRRPILNVGGTIPEDGVLDEIKGEKGRVSLEQAFFPSMSPRSPGEKL